MGQGEPILKDCSAHSKASRIPPYDVDARLGVIEYPLRDYAVHATSIRSTMHLTLPLVFIVSDKGMGTLETSELTAST